MAEIIYYTDEQVFTDGTTAGTILVFDEDRVKKASIHQVTLTPSDDESVTGSVLIGYRSITNKVTDGVEYVSDGFGSTLIVDLADGVQSITFEAAVSVLAIALSSDLSGGDVRVGCSGW